MKNHYYAITDMETGIETVVDDGRYRLSATSAAFHEKHPEEDTVIAVKNVTYDEIRDPDRYENDSYAKYLVGKDTFVYIPKRIIDDLSQKYGDGEKDRLIRNALWHIAVNETVRVAMQDEHGNTISLLRVNKRNEDLRLAKKEPSGDYVYDYYENDEIEIDGEKYQKIIPIGHENSQFEFLKEYIPKEKILERLVKKELPFGIVGEYLPKSLFDEYEKAREERKREYERELLEKFNTPPVLYLALDEESIPRYPNSWYPNLDMRHLFNPAYLGDCENVLAEYDYDESDLSSLRYKDFERVIYIPQTRSGTTYAVSVAMGLNEGVWYELGNANYYANNPNENIAHDDIYATFNDPNMAWQHYQGYFYDPEEMDVDEEYFKLSEEYLKEVEKKKRQRALYSIPIEIRSASREVIEAYKERLRRYETIGFAGNVKGIVKRSDYYCEVYAEKEVIGRIIGKKGRNVKATEEAYDKSFRILERPKATKIEKIVSHKEPRHLDDFLAIALLKNGAPDARIEYLRPQSVPEEYLSDPKVALVDVGGEFNPVNFNYDHHQNVYAYPSSVILVLADVYKKSRINSKALAITDYVDRYGYPKAASKFDLKPSDEVQEKLKTLLMADLNDHETSRIVADATLMSVDEREQSYDDFIRTLYDRLKKARKLDRAIERIEKEKDEFRRKLNEALVLNANGVKAVVSKESFAPFHKKAFEHYDADVIIERNAMNPNQTSIIKNTAKEGAENIDLEKAFNSYPKVFLHGTGFIAVVDTSIDDIDADAVFKIVDEVVNKQEKTAKRLCPEIKLFQR